MLAVVFVLAGIYVATEEALEDSLAAELVDKEHHGMGFGMLATVNGVGDFVERLVGALWTGVGNAGGVRLQHGVVRGGRGGRVAVARRVSGARVFH